MAPEQDREISGFPAKFPGKTADLRGVGILVFWGAGDGWAYGEEEEGEEK